MMGEVLKKERGRKRLIDPFSDRWWVHTSFIPRGERERVNGARGVDPPDDVRSVDVLSLSRLDGLISADQQDDGHDGYLDKCSWGDYPINSLHGCFGLSLKWIQRDPTFQSVHCEEGFDAPELWRLAACWLIIPPTMPPWPD